MCTLGYFNSDRPSPRVKLATHLLALNNKPNNTTQQFSRIVLKVS